MMQTSIKRISSIHELNKKKQQILKCRTLYAVLVYGVYNGYTYYITI